MPDTICLRFLGLSNIYVRAGFLTLFDFNEQVVIAHKERNILWCTLHSRNLNAKPRVESRTLKAVGQHSSQLFIGKNIKFVRSMDVFKAILNAACALYNMNF